MLVRQKEPVLTDFGELFMPEEAAEPILGRVVRAALTEWLEEIWARDELEAVGVKPRTRAIFNGPPGVGKTTLAHHLSARLGLPMLAVRPDCIIDCWVGSSGRNIGALFECAKAGVDGAPVLLFLDEFEALGGKRAATKQAAGAARNEMVDTLLQRLEQHDGLLIAATNFADRVDPAMHRRFDMHITLELPGQGERERILARYLAPFGLPRDDLARLAEALDTASPALIRQLCENLKRQLIVGPKLDADMRCGAVFERLLASCQPHPDLGKPRLWSHGAADKAVAAMPWPLPRLDDLAAMQPAEDAPAPAEIDNVVKLGKRG